MEGIVPKVKYDDSIYFRDPKAIIIPTYDLAHRFPILKACTDSIKTNDYINKIIVVNGESACDGKYFIPGWMMVPNPINGMEVGAMYRAIQFVRMSELFLLHDTCRITDNSLWDKVFLEKANKNVAISPKYLMLIGKYVVNDLLATKQPFINNKLDGHLLGEKDFIERFTTKFPYEILCPEFIDDNATHEQRWGRDNLKLTCQYMIKYKGNFKLDHLKNGGIHARAY